MDPRALLDTKIPWYLSTFSALDRYYRRTEQPSVHIAITDDVVQLAKAVPDLEFPGVDHADAAVSRDGVRVYFTCIDSVERPPRRAIDPLNLLYDPVGDRYLDPHGVYRSVRSERLEIADLEPAGVQSLIDAAMTVARYPHTLESGIVPVPRIYPDLDPETQRMVLSNILTGTSPWEGLRLLEAAGFIDAYWPELAAMRNIAHSKEHHPEGDVWTHTLETFRYRKTADTTLTLGLLLHDVGKPHAPRTRERAFDGHAEEGIRHTRSFLRRLEFPQPVIDDVIWLVAKHMFPAALGKLPLFRTERMMSDPRFPLLLELYRCDLESTYRGPDGYYRACKVYRDYLHNSRSPFRSAEGKKLMRLYVE